MLGLSVRYGTSRMARKRAAQIRPIFGNHRDTAFKVLGLKSFSDEEIKSSFEKLKSTPDDDGVNVFKGVQALGAVSDHDSLSESKAFEVSKLVLGDSTPFSTMLTFADYKKSVLALGEKLDSRVWNLGLSFLFTGVSVGVIIPCMPLLVSQLNIPPSDFGMVISAFGLSKLLGNIPSGYLVEKYGRKPMLVTGLGMCSLGLGSLGLTLLPGFGTSWLIACRFFSGLGVSAFLAGGYMFMSDISTPLNRTRTIAPVMAGFSAGAALGPALGGFLIGSVGISMTYVNVGCMFGALAISNYLLLQETMAKATVMPASAATAAAPPPAAPSGVEGVRNSFSVAFKSWGELMQKSRLSEVIRLNGAYWFAYSGTQMTLLPLLMVSPALQLSAFEIGGCFAMMSAIAFAASQPSAIIADKFGKSLNITLGGSLLTVAMLSLSQVTEIPTLVAVLAPLALGATVMNSTPTALVSDYSTGSERAQAMSLLRTAGDMGLLLGAGCSGLMASLTSIEAALQMNGVIMASSMLWFGFRNYQFNKNKCVPIEKESK